MLRAIATDIWAHEGDIPLPGGMNMPGRATIMRLEGGALAIHSPLPIDDDLAREIDALGEVRHLVAPNLLHWLYLGAAKKRYPAARVHAPAGLEKKLKGSLEFDPLPAEGCVPGASDLRVACVAGAPSVREHAFLHAPSRSLVACDLLFNVRACSSAAMRFLLRGVGAWDKPAQSLTWRFLVRDRAAAASSVAREVPAEHARVVVAHGDVLEGDGRRAVEDATRWMGA
jgi:hypothetical protein